ncbi:MAG: hypothetical protein Q9166_005661 [cf. Caloplaca sp. 2 TL-2023]
MKMGAGVQAIDAYKYAHAFGFVIVGSISPTVGITGGYTQGGGHGPLASKFGMAADQALEWEVVTALGEHLLATPFQHADLYWALSGGGGGTFGVVVSLTVKAYRDLITSAANLTFSSAGASPSNFWNAVKTFQKGLPSIVDTGTYVSFFLTNESFTVTPMQGPGVSKAQLQELLNPTLSVLKEGAIRYTFHIDEFPTFYDSYKSYNVPVNVSQLQIGGRLIPRSLVENNISTLIQAEQSIVGSGIGAILSGVCINVSVADPAINSINPVWRTALFDAVIGTPYNYTDDLVNVAYANRMTREFIPSLEALTPSGGSYLSEADFQQPNFQTVLYGVNYSSLKAIKSKYDPLNIFYAITAVGSEDWYEDRTQGGRLCPTN